MGGFIGATNLRTSKNGVSVGSRSKVNFVEGSNVTLTITDDSVNDEIDIEIASTGGGGGGGTWSNIDGGQANSTYNPSLTIDGGASA